MNITKYISDVPSDKTFRAGKGIELKNLNELLSHLKSEGEPFFNNHVNESKNDFGNWVHHVIGDLELSQNLFVQKSYNKTVALIEERINTLTNQAENNQKFDGIGAVFENDMNSVFVNSLDLTQVGPSHEFETKFDHNKIIDIIEKNRVSHAESDLENSSEAEEKQGDSEIFSNAPVNESQNMAIKEAIGEEIADEELKMYKKKLDVAFEKLSSGLKYTSSDNILTNQAQNKDNNSIFSNLTFDIGIGRFFESIKNKIRRN